MTRYAENHWPTLSAAVPDARLRVISLGAGVQSTALALMAARHEIGPMPDAAIFADTGWEPRRVYEHLDWLERVLPFPVIRVRRDGASLGDFQMETVTLPLKGRPTVPLYLDEPVGMMAKQCSKEWKTRVVQRQIASMLGLAPGERGPREVVVEQWIGMDKGELERARTSEKKWIQNRWPLIERDMRRHDAIRWMEERQYPRPPKSSCIFCPFRDDDGWVDMQENAPADFERACQADEAFRPGYLGMTGAAYVHWSRQPLRTADFSRRRPDEGVLFGMSECEARCDA